MISSFEKILNLYSLAFHQSLKNCSLQLVGITTLNQSYYDFKWGALGGQPNKTFGRRMHFSRWFSYEKFFYYPRNHQTHFILLPLNLSFRYRFCVTWGILILNIDYITLPCGLQNWLLLNSLIWFGRDSILTNESLYVFLKLIRKQIFLQSLFYKNEAPVIIP